MDSLTKKLKEVCKKNSCVCAFRQEWLLGDMVSIIDANDICIGVYSLSYFQKCHKKVFGYTCKDVKKFN